MESIPARFRAKRDIIWDNWGTLVTVMYAGQETRGELHLPFNPERPWEYCSIESTVYPGVTDFASQEEVELIS